MSKHQTAHNPFRVLYAILLIILCTIVNITYTAYAQKQTNKPKTEKDQFSRPEPTRPIRPEIPTANRNQQDKVFLEYADELSANEYSDGHQLLRGNVKFRKAGMFMYCDSAYFYPETNSLDAFGNVKMEQGDTLFVFADILYYNGESQLARLRSKGRHKVELRHIANASKTKKTLTTDSLDYSLAYEEANYFNGGRMINYNLSTYETDTLTSLDGIYRVQTEELEVFNDLS